MNLTKDFCVLTQVMPQILYHLEDDLLETLKGRHRQKREPVSLTLAVLLGLGGAAAGIGTGTTALIQGNQQLTQLQLAIDTDLQAIENLKNPLPPCLKSRSKIEGV